MKRKYILIFVVAVGVSASLWAAAGWASKDWKPKPEVVEIASVPEPEAVEENLPSLEEIEKVPTIGKIAAPIFQPVEERDDAMLFEVEVLSFLPFESF